MDLTALSSMLQPYLSGVQHNALPFLAGAMLTHPLLCADLLFKAWMAFPLTRAYTLAHPDAVINWIDSFREEIDKKVKEAAAPAPAPAPPADQGKP